MNPTQQALLETFQALQIGQTPPNAPAPAQVPPNSTIYQEIFERLRKFFGEYAPLGERFTLEAVRSAEFVKELRDFYNTRSGYRLVDSVTQNFGYKIRNVNDRREQDYGYGLKAPLISNPCGVKSLSSITLPPQLVEKLQSEYRVEIKTAYNWLKAYLPRLSFGEMELDVFASTVLIPLGRAEDKVSRGHFVPTLSVNPWECYVVLSFNNAGNVFGNTRVYGHPSKSCIADIQAKDNKDWAVFPFTEATLQSIGERSPELAEGIRTNHIVNICFPMKEKPIPRPVVPVVKQSEKIVYRTRGGGDEDSSRGSVPYGMITYGQERRVDSPSSDFNGGLELGSGRPFIVYTAAIPVELSEKFTIEEISALSTQHLTALDQGLNEMRSLASPSQKSPTPIPSSALRV